MNELKRQARIARFCSHAVAVLAVLQCGYVGYNALVHGASAIGFRSGVISFLFNEAPFAATIVLMVNIGLVLLLFCISRACHREHMIWME